MSTFGGSELGMCSTRFATSPMFSRAHTKVDFANFGRTKADKLLNSNFWAGTEKFWDRFMAFVEPLANAADSVPELFDPAPYQVGQTVCYFPFVFERLFTTFITLNPDIRVCAWKYSFEDTLRNAKTPFRYMLLTQWAPIIERWDAEGVYPPSGAGSSKT